MQIDITDAAFNRVTALTLTKNDHALVLRIIVNSGGCSGFMYEYIMTKDYNVTDDYVFTKNNSIIVIDKISAEYMNGCKVDFIEELGNSYFNISNPKTTARCGCGNSFAI